MLKKFTNKKGFTLMEMLIVVAIIAVLVAIAIPTFSGQLKKANEATDAANIRAAYAEAALNALENDGTGTATTKAAMKTTTWDTFNDTDTIGDKKIKDIKKTKDKTMKVDIADDGTVTFTATT
ncbi:competence type IV pilus major pilin ComGC [Dysosmobacter sp.]|uniref:competence type IV pilus major pilin ComGC n=1 Tax=Dysosmobacter sp. TaxID=2591382 RepID=UPI003FD8E2A6